MHFAGHARLGREPEIAVARAPADAWAYAAEVQVASGRASKVNTVVGPEGSGEAVPACGRGGRRASWVARHDTRRRSTPSTGRSPAVSILALGTSSSQVASPHGACSALRPAVDELRTPTSEFARMRTYACGVQHRVLPPTGARHDRSLASRCRRRLPTARRAALESRPSRRHAARTREAHA